MYTIMILIRFINIDNWRNNMMYIRLLIALSIYRSSPYVIIVTEQGIW